MVRLSPRSLLAYILISLLLFLPQITPLYSYHPLGNVKETSVTGPMSDEIVVLEVSPSTLYYSLGSAIDGYLKGLKADSPEFNSIADRSDIKFLTSYYALADILFNPAPVYTVNYTTAYTKEEIASREGVPVEAITYYEADPSGSWAYAEFGAHPDHGINIFAFRKIRHAVNYLYDRNYFIDTYMHGKGLPTYFPLTLEDPLMKDLADLYAKYSFPESFGIANQTIADQLTAIGAEYIDGHWSYAGEQISITFIIRYEDYRRFVGDYLADQFELIGFDVNRTYLGFADAINLVYYTDPANLEWHLYTEGWTYTYPLEEDRYILTSLGSPDGYIPGASVDGWKYRNDTIRDACNLIQNYEFSSWSDYIEAYRNALDLIMEDSLRVYVALTYYIYPVMDYVRGITIDRSLGLQSPYNIHEAYAPSTPLKLGYPDIKSIIWNPMILMFDHRGLIDLYRLTYDPPYTRNPLSNRLEGFRTSYTIEGYDPPISPSEATVKWDWSADSWEVVTSGAPEIRSSVTYNLTNLINTRWHNNVNITWTDITGFYALLTEIAYDNSYYTEGSLANRLKNDLDKIVGFDFNIDENTLTIYFNYYGPRSELLANSLFWILLSPFELELISFRLTYEKGFYAYTETGSMIYDVDILNLVNTTQLAVVSAEASSLIDNSTAYSLYAPMFSPYGTPLMSFTEWNERIGKVYNYILDNGNAWISQGPYYITEYDTEDGYIRFTAYRDPTYPYRPGDLVYSEPVDTSMVSIDYNPIVPGEDAVITVETSGGAERIVAYNLRYTPLDNVYQYGFGTEVSDGVFEITIPSSVTSTLTSPRIYELVLIIESFDQLTRDIRSIPIYVGPDASTLEYIEPGSSETLTAEGTEVSGQASITSSGGGVEAGLTVFNDFSMIGVPPPPGGETGFAVDLYINDTDSVTWPVYVEVSYNPDDLPPDAVEEYLGLYYYNITSNTWMRCSNTGVDTGSHIVWAYITEEEYEAGIGNIFILSPYPPPSGGVGGSIDLGVTGPSNTYIVAIALLLALLLAKKLLKRR